MGEQPYISLIFPAYNEAKRIKQTVTDAVDYFNRRQLSYQIIVSADGDDGTREIVAGMAASNHAIKVTGTSKRSGKGQGLRRAMPLANGKYVGFSDADNKTPIEEFDKIEPYLQQGFDLVIGSRAMATSRIEKKQPLYRQLGSKCFAFIMHAIMGLPDITDTQCGFKFFQRPIGQDLFSRQKIDGYMYDVEILYIAQISGYRIAQVPIRWRDDGDSRYDVLVGSIRNMRELLSIRLAAMRGVYIVNRATKPTAGQVR